MLCDSKICFQVDIFTSNHPHINDCSEGLENLIMCILYMFLLKLSKFYQKISRFSATISQVKNTFSYFLCAY